VEAAKNYGGRVMVDLLGVSDPTRRAMELEKMGIDYIGMHTSIDEQMRGKDPFSQLREVSRTVSVPVAVAGGINSETVAKAIDAGASVVIVGGAVIKAKDPQEATRTIKEAIKDKKVIFTQLFKSPNSEELSR